jgi:signal transduction histidine kinase/DNA-binding response OmpR family regulator
MKYLILVFICLPLWSFSQTLELVTNTESYPITPVAGLYTDATGRLPLAEIEKQQFEITRKKGLLYPFSDAAFWLKISLTNRNPERKQWVLAWDNPMAEEVNFYISNNDGTYRNKKTGIINPAHRILMAENKPFFAFDLDYQATKTIYIQVKGQRAHYAAVNLFSAQAYNRYDLIQTSLYGFMSGAIAIRLFYILLLAVFAVKDSDFRQYSVLLVIRSFAFWGLHGIIGNFFLNPTTSLTAGFISSHFLPLGLILAFKVIFPGNRFPIWITRVLQVMMALNVLLAVPIFFGYRWQWIMASTYLVIATQVFILAMYVFAILKKYPINWNYSVAYLFGIGSYILVQMRLVQWIDYAWINPVALLCFGFEFFVFGYFLGRIVIDYERNRKLSVQELEFAKEQATRIQELDHLKTRFFTNISHEFRTPLTLLTGPLEELQQKYPKEALLSMMRRNVSRLQVLINQLLDLSKLEAGEMKVEMQQGNLAQFFLYIFSSFESLAQNQQIHFHIIQNQPSFEAYFDADKIEKIITNLLSNAFKFTPKNGRITVTVEYSPPAPNGGVAFFSPIGGAVITISDNGIGIDPQRLPRIFDRFYQVDDTSQRNYEGTGIGLALVKELVDMLQGTISVSSQVNQGTTFRVELPLSEPIQEAAAHHPPTTTLISQAAITSLYNDTPTVADLNHSAKEPMLLIVEDNPDLRFYLRSLFEAHYQIIEATDGQNGLEVALETVPDIVVTDLMMPRLDGFSLCQRLKSDERTSHIPVILLTAKATLSDRLEGLELGADDYLQKPFSKDELLIRVKNLLQQRAILRQKFSLTTPSQATTDTNTTSQKLDNQFMQKTYEVVEAHLSESGFEVEDLCRELGMSRTNLQFGHRVYS